MAYEISVIKYLQLPGSDIGKIIRHLKMLRNHVGHLRIALVEIKQYSRAVNQATGGEKMRNPELVEAFEAAIASAEQEMATLARAIETNLRKHDK